MCKIIVDGETVEFEGSVLNHEVLNPYRKTAREIKICDSVTEIGTWAFAYFNLLESVEIPDSVISIHRYAFSDCEVLKSVTLPNSVCEIPQGAFMGCSSLKSISIPDLVTIGQEAFYGCDNIRIKLKNVNGALQEKSLVGKIGQIITVDSDGNDYSVLTYSRKAHGKMMIITGYVDYAGGTIYSGYKISSKLNPPKKTGLHCYIRNHCCLLRSSTLEELKERFEKVDIR